VTSIFNIWFPFSPGIIQLCSFLLSGDISLLDSDGGFIFNKIFFNFVVVLPAPACVCIYPNGKDIIYKDIQFKRGSIFISIEHVDFVHIPLPQHGMDLASIAYTSLPLLLTSVEGNWRQKAMMALMEFLHGQSPNVMWCKHRIPHE